MHVEIDDKAYVNRDGAKTSVLRDIRFDIHDHELVVLTGPSGCGKTTLLNIIAGLDKDYRGRVSLPPGGDSNLPLSYVFQEHRLLPWRTIRENIELVMPPGEHTARIMWLLKKTNLEQVADSYPAALSMGMSRRVALVRAFAVTAPVMLMDEPFASIDEATALRMRKLLLFQHEASPRTILFVTHNLQEALFLGDRLLILSSRPATLIADLPLKPARHHRTPEIIETMYEDLVRRFPKVLA